MSISGMGVVGCAGNVHLIDNMKNLFFYILCAMTISACANDIVELNGGITGRVSDANDGRGLSNCQVVVNPGSMSLTTNADGSYEFRDLEPGYYTLTFVKAGYEEKKHDIEVIAGQMAHGDILLTPKSAFAMSQMEIDFGDLETSRVVYFYNNTDEGCSYEIKNIPSWLSMSNTSGSVSPGGQIAVSATANRDNLSYGTHSQVMTVTYSGKTSGNAILTARIEKVQISTPIVECAGNGVNITETSFRIDGEIKKTGGRQITNYGHCWSVNPSPTIDDNKTTLGSTTSVGPYTSEVTGLTTGTKYYVRAYATNSEGTSYSREVIVNTNDAQSDKWNGDVASEFESGSGTSSKPYVIKTAAQFANMRNHADKHFVLAGNIDLNNINWKPFEFSGSLDGKGFVVSNLYVNRTDDYQGLFSKIKGYYNDPIKVKNLTIRGVNISSDNSYVGAVAGLSEGSFIQNCKVILTDRSEISGDDHVGGIVGLTWDTDYMTVYDCEVESQFDGLAILGNSNVGGITGAGMCEGCKVSADIAGEDNVGGITGYFDQDSFYEDSIVSECSFSGEISGTDKVGGIAGSFEYGSIRSCKVNADIIAEGNYVGGIVGYCKYYSAETSYIIACYSDGQITASPNAENVGGLVGRGHSSVEVSLSYSTMTSTSSDFDGIGGYYDYYSGKNSSAAEIVDCCTVANTDRDGTNIKSNCTDITSFLRDAYSEHAGLWDFKNTWTWSGKVNGKQVNVSCPHLAWE